MFRGILRTFRLSITLAGAGLAFFLPATAGTVFWIEPRSNVLLDQQVVSTVAPDADLVVLRASIDHPVPDYTLHAIVPRFRKAGTMPVLAYAWANRYARSARSEGDLLRGIDTGVPLAEMHDSRKRKVTFLDIRDEEVRRRVVSRFVAARTELGVDGFAVDLATRTPRERPTVLAGRCKQDADFCSTYAEAMDALFGDLRRALGDQAYIVYNGLSNFSSDELHDQVRLLKNANAAVIERFGRHPSQRSHSFAGDIQPFLKIMRALPKDKVVLTFGRGSRLYTDYLEDYGWQRYLYASFLLGARTNDLFKYHSSFQVPAPKGRTGGLDAYADWRVDLGAPRGDSVSADGLHRREFARGLVVVAPDDGRGGTIDLSRQYVTPEGQSLDGSLRVEPGTGMLLLNQRENELNRPNRRLVTAADIAAWNWSRADLDRTSDIQGRFIKLDDLPSELLGEHDLLLDWERSLQPYRRVEIRADLCTDAASLLAVAEVDDRKRKYDTVIIEASQRSGDKQWRLVDAVPFRSPVAERGGEVWPLKLVELPPNQGQMVIDGPALIDDTRYRFRRWSHLRFVGPLAVSEVILSDPFDTLRVLTER